ncbi:MAG TPA: hypothetical protein VFB60_19415 [Ktedonobacteraceae bacterium]|nr:hypothetical protein [Ktedonobacteraceae bacterium]
MGDVVACQSALVCAQPSLNAHALPAVASPAVVAGSVFHYKADARLQLLSTLLYPVTGCQPVDTFVYNLLKLL